MAKQDPDQFPALQPVRDALERLYNLAVKFPVDLDNISDDPPFEHAEAQRHKLRAWAKSLREAYGVAPQDPQIPYDAENEPDPNPRLVETSLLGALLADKRLEWNANSNAPFAARYLIGLPPRELIWPDHDFISPDGARIESPQLPPPPEWLHEMNVKEEWGRGGWPQIKNTIRETYLLERTRALALCRWTIKALADFEESILPKFRVRYNKDQRGHMVSAVVEVTWLGHSKERKITATPALLLSKLISIGKGDAQMHTRDDLTAQLPEIAPYLRAAKAPRGTKVRGRKDYTTYAVDEKTRTQFTVLTSEADLKQA